MLRITPSQSAHGATAYFNAELSRGDYYADKGELIGRWHGKGADMLRLSGEVTREQFAALAGNHHPASGEQLTPRQKADRRAGYDFTFSAPKSVSAFYEYLQATGRADQAGALLDAFKGAVRSTMGELETDMRVRVRAHGADTNRVTGNMAWAEFTHFQSRPVDGYADPHLHTHAFAMNLTHDGERWKAGQFGDIKRDATYYQEAFHARLAAGLQRMGFGVTPALHGFELCGVGRETIDKFSRRTAEVERESAAKGITYAEDKARQGAATRRNKDEGLSPEATRTLFMQRLSETERVTFERIAGGDGSPPGGMRAEEALDYALKHSFERSSALSEKRLLAEALKAGMGAALPEDVQAAATARKDILRGERDGERMVTTEAVLAEERAMLNFARLGAAEHAAIGQGATWEFRRAWLSDEQRGAVTHVLASTDRVIGIRGGAGTGKTAMMQEAVEAVAALTGKAPVVLAPSAEASRGVLREEGFRDADTVARFLSDAELQQSARDGVIFLDEAGLLGSRDMRALFDVAAAQNARVVLQGDVRQHASVARGDALRLLESKAGVGFATLSTIRRQKPAAYREAVAALAQGETARGFAALDAMGAVTEIADASERDRQLAGRYLEALARGESALVVSPTHAEGGRVTELIREGMKERGSLTETRAVVQLKPTNWTEAERGRASSYAPGMEVSFHQNAKGFARGERATVLAVQDGTVTLWTEKKEVRTLPLAAAARFQVFERHALEVGVGDLVRLSANGRDHSGGRLNNGAQYRIGGFTREGDLVLEGAQGGTRVIGKGFGHLAHGYVATSHASQGKTVDRVFIAQSAESLGASGRAQFYVSASRGRLSVQVFTDDKAGLARAITRIGERVAASELVHEANAEPAPQRAGVRSRVRAKVIELAMKAREWRRERMQEEREDSGTLAVRGWPTRGRGPEPEPGR
jgi:conjugative relaxase-like TrwC/TraI family protein